MHNNLIIATVLPYGYAAYAKWVKCMLHRCKIGAHIRSHSSYISCCLHCCRPFNLLQLGDKNVMQFLADITDTKVEILLPDLVVHSVAKYWPREYKRAKNISLHVKVSLFWSWNCSIYITSGTLSYYQMKFKCWYGNGMESVVGISEQ